VSGCRMGSSAGGFGLDVAGQDDGVQDQTFGECRDPSNGGDDVLASAQHQAAVNDNPEELPVGPQGNLLNLPRPARRVFGAGSIEAPA